MTCKKILSFALILGMLAAAAPQALAEEATFELTADADIIAEAAPGTAEDALGTAEYVSNEIVQSELADAIVEEMTFQLGDDSEEPSGVDAVEQTETGAPAAVEAASPAEPSEETHETPAAPSGAAEEAPAEADEAPETPADAANEAPAVEPSEDEPAPVEDNSKYIINYPDVCDLKDYLAPSDRVYPGILLWPLEGQTPLAHVTSHVGWRNAGRIHANQGGTWPSWLHHGVDVGGVDTSQVVVAAAPGVAYAGYSGGEGNYVVIDHGNGWYTKYQHLSRFTGSITRGCRAVEVGYGDPIGYVGRSGGNYPVHFHFEIAWSPDGAGSDDIEYHRQTHNQRIRAYSFPQEKVITLHWARRWEICTAENQNYAADMETLMEMLAEIERNRPENRIIPLP